MRNLPDVAAAAENVWVTYDNGKTESVGGTSCSSPLWAGFAALINQQAAAFGRPPVGFLNPAIYALGTAPGYTTNFHDITTGSNTNSDSPNAFSAVAGYDLCTGWGTPLGQNLINALAPRVRAIFLTNGVTALVSEGCSNGALDPGETVTMNFGLKNLGAVKTTNLVATLVADGSIRWPSEPQSYGVLTGGGPTVSRPFTFTANAACGGTLTAMLQLQDGAANLGTLAFNVPVGKPLTVFAQAFDTVTPPALPAGWTVQTTNGLLAWVTSTLARDSTPNSAFADEPAFVGTEELLSPPINITSTNAQASFRNNFNTEADPNDAAVAYDGGLLEIRIGTNDFTDILDAGGSFVSGGYTRTIAVTTNSDNPFPGRRVWGGNSGGFITSLVNLPASAAGQTIQLKWLFALDTGNFYGGSGWYVDSVSVLDGSTCCDARADLVLAAAASPGTIGLGQVLTYFVSVTNSGPSSAYGVVVTNSLAATVTLVSASPGCWTNNGQVLCDVGVLPAGSGTNFSFGVTPTTSESITNHTTLWGFTPDPDVSNNSASTVSAVTTNSAPMVFLQPTNAVAVRGGVATFEAQVFGAAPLVYQWFFNSAPIVGETLPTLSLTNVQPEQSGAYTLSVTNLNGAATSPVVQLTVVAAPSIQIGGLGSADGALTISFPSIVGLSYTLEYKDSLTDTAWTPLPPPVAGTGMPLSLADTNGFSLPARFYRLTAH